MGLRNPAREAGALWGWQQWESLSPFGLQGPGVGGMEPVRAGTPETGGPARATGMRVIFRERWGIDMLT